MDPIRPPLPERATLTLRADPTSGPAALPGRLYLLVLEGLSSRVFPLPPEGELIIGRAKDADLCVSDGSASRRHASLSICRGEVRITDLGSHNGTRVNAQPLSAPRVLVGGDVVSICGVTLVLHRDVLPGSRRAVQEFAALRQRLDEEVERALRTERSLGLLWLELPPGTDRALVAEALYGPLRSMDFAAWCGAEQLAVLLPDLYDNELVDAARALRTALGTRADSARIGRCSCPEDGGEPDTLLALVRAAAARAQAGGDATAAEAAVSRQVGPHQLLLLDPAMLQIYDLIERLAPSDLPVLVCGETGTGKELAAAALHHGSPRRGGPLLALNCAALQETLAESELFGHERGAFSGAVAAKPGLLESASGGTVFLDEVGELSPAVQAKLLRVLETRQVMRVGAVRERPIDLRLVAATHRDLEQEVRAGRFRQDLYFRLGAAALVLPPLRDRRGEVPLLARAFLSAARQRLHREPLSISHRAMVQLLRHEWPGNVRELKNAMDYAAATARDIVLEPWHLPVKLGGRPAADPWLAPAPGEAAVEPAEEGQAGGQRGFRAIEEELRELERTRMAEALEATGGVVTRAAALIAMPERTFFNKVKLYGLSPRAVKERTAG